VAVDDLPPPLPEFAPSVDRLRTAYKAMQGVNAEEEQGLGAVNEDDEKENAAADDAEDRSNEFDPDTLYTAIMCTDSTVVYYKLSRGIRKPHDIPDE
jgi:hypothetical protein